MRYADEEVAAYLGGDHYEVLLRIERVLRADANVRPDLVRPRIPRRNEDCISRRRTQLVERRARELPTWQGVALLEGEITQVGELVRPMYLRE